MSHSWKREIDLDTDSVRQPLQKLGRIRLTPANRQSGKIGWALLWLLGIPLPILLVLYLIRGH